MIGGGHFPTAGKFRNAVVPLPSLLLHCDTFATTPPNRVIASCNSTTTDAPNNTITAQQNHHSTQTFFKPRPRHDYAFSGRPIPEAVAAEKNYEMSMDLRIQIMKNMIGEVDRAGKARERVYVGRACGSVRDGDFLDVLLDHTEGNSTQELSSDNINVLLMDLFLGGTHTTTTLLEWAMAELLHNPPILAKAKQELSKIIPPLIVAQEQDIPQLPYLDAIVKEALKPTPDSATPYPAYWDDPTCFKPERFLNSDIDIRDKHFEYILFGAGWCSCPGSSLAMRMVSLMLANLLHSFDWELSNGLKTEDMDMGDGFGMALHKHEPLVVVPVKC
ncbi:hypothetical protein BUALT_Bualt05G0066200 [Buddleja alternifolia]|uniref:Cytochrome P450 n=1 Tax=Buddleja alternifolia TaxID=168488 RepID=A0AAV6XT02_9LAMI|nr:hypothetical protein BUALT_Bualt05G0066200 [Buddleja alternifolia]